MGYGLIFFVGGKKKKGVKVNEDNKKNIKSADIFAEEDVQDNEDFFLLISVCNFV